MQWWHHTYRGHETVYMYLKILESYVHPSLSCKTVHEFYTLPLTILDSYCSIANRPCTCTSIGHMTHMQDTDFHVTHSVDYEFFSRDTHKIPSLPWHSTASPLKPIRCVHVIITCMLFHFFTVNIRFLFGKSYHWWNVEAKPPPWQKYNVYNIGMHIWNIGMLTIMNSTCSFINRWHPFSIIAVGAVVPLVTVSSITQW